MIKGKLSIYEKDCLWKFCSECGEKVRGFQWNKKRHCDRTHGKVLHDFLDFNMLPKNSKWVNFEDYLKDPNVKLIAR